MSFPVEIGRYANTFLSSIGMPDRKRQIINMDFSRLWRGSEQTVLAVKQFLSGRIVCSHQDKYLLHHRPVG